MTEIVQNFAPLILHYKKILRKEPEIILIELKRETDETKAKKFRKKYGVMFEEIKEKYANLIIYSPWGQEKVLIELGVILSFIPEKFRSMKIIRRMLFLVLHQPYYRNLSGQSDIKKFYDSEILEFQKEFGNRFQGLLNKNIINQYIAGVKAEELLRKIIPFLDFASKKSEVMENLYFVFKPEPRNKSELLTKLAEIDRFFEVENLEKKNIFLKENLLEYPFLTWNYSSIHLRLFRLSIFAKPQYLDSLYFRNNLIEKLKETPNLLFFTIEKASIIILGIIPDNYDEWMEQMQKNLEMLKQRWIISYFLGFVENFNLKINNQIKQASFSDNSKKIQNITKFDILIALGWRHIFPSFAFIENLQQYFSQFQKNLFAFFEKNKKMMEQQFSDWWPNSQKKFSQKKCKEVVCKAAKLKLFTPLTINSFQYFKYNNKITIELLGTKKSIDQVSNKIGLYSWQEIELDNFNDPKNQIDISLILDHKNFLGIIPIFIQKPIWALSTSLKVHREMNPLQLIPYFNEETQSWRPEPFPPDFLNNISEFSNNTLTKYLSEIPLKPFAPSFENVDSDAAFYRKVLQIFDKKKLNHEKIEDFLKKRFKNPSEFDYGLLFKSKKTGKYPQKFSKIQYYLDKYENLKVNSFPPPINSSFTRIHVIIRSITRSVHPEALMQDPELRGLFAIGLVQCWYWGGTLDGSLLLEYYVPASIMAEQNHEFNRMMKRLSLPRNDISITILQVEHCQTFYSSYYLNAEDWKVGEFLRLKIPGNKPLNNGFTAVKYHQFMPLSSEPQADLVQTWYDDSHLPYNPVFGDWFHWLYLQHSITQFIYLKNVPKPQLEFIYSFFRQAPIGEIYTCRNQKTRKTDIYIILRFRKQIFWMLLKIHEFMQSFSLNGFYSFVFPWTRFVHSPISQIIRESRKNPWYYKQSCYGMQFPIFHFHQWSICYGPEEQFEMYHLIPVLKGPKGGIPTTKKVKVEYELRRGNDITKNKKKPSLSEKLDYSKMNSEALSR